MADLARLRRMAPFADLSTQQFRAVIGELKTLFEPSTSGSSLGSYSSPTTRAIRGLGGAGGGGSGGGAEIHVGLVKEKTVYVAPDSFKYEFCRVVRLLSTPGQFPVVYSNTCDTVHMFPPGQLYIPNKSWVHYSLVSGTGGEAFLGWAVIVGWQWNAGEYYAPPDCAIENCGLPVPPDDEPAWPQGACP